MSTVNRNPYEQAYYPPVPNRLTSYMRNSVVWQFIRFWIINLKVLMVLLRSGH